MAKHQNFTQGQKYALLILAKYGAKFSDKTLGGVGRWENKQVNRDVAEWLIERGLAVAEGERVLLTDAGHTACRQVHHDWYDRYGPGSDDNKEHAS